MHTKKLVGYISAILSVVLFGGVGVFIRNIAANEYIITFGKLLVGLVFLTPALFLRKEHLNIRKQFSLYLLLTGFLLAMIMLSYVNAINNTSLANAAFLLYLGPLLAVGIAAVFLKEKFTLLNGCLISSAFLGFVFLLEFKLSFNVEESKGCLWGFIAGMSYALYIVLNRKIPHTIPSVTRTFYQFIFGLLAMLPFLDASLLNLTPKDLYWLIAAGFFQGFLAILLFVVAIKYLKSVEYGTVSYIEPLVATLLGFTLYSEILSPLQLIGCAIILLGGVFQVTRTEGIG